MSDSESTTAATQTNPRLALSSCMGSSFKPLEGDISSGNEWKLSFDKNKNEVTLDVTINTPTMLVDINNQKLTSSFGLDDVQALLVWLHQVRATISLQNKKSANSTEPTKGDSKAVES